MNAAICGQANSYGQMKTQPMIVCRWKAEGLLTKFRSSLGECLFRVESCRGNFGCKADINGQRCERRSRLLAPLIRLSSHLAPSSRTARSRSELPITITELSDIAAPAMIGESKIWNQG